MIFTKPFIIFSSASELESSSLCFLYIQKGFIEICADGNRYELKCCNGIILPHGFTVVSSTENLLGLQLILAFPFALPCAVTVKSSPKSMLRRAICDLLSSKNTDPAAITKILTDYCTDFIKQTGASCIIDNPDYALMAKKYIDENFSNDITLLNVARFCGISKSCLALSFSEKTGISPWRYLTQKRIEKACILLEQTLLSSKEIAIAVGYRSPQRFNQMFKSLTNCTPSEYRAGIKCGKNV